MSSKDGWGSNKTHYSIYSTRAVNCSAYTVLLSGAKGKGYFGRQPYPPVENPQTPQPMRALAMLFTLAFLQLVLCYSSFSQCKTAPPLEACLGTEPTVTNNETLLNGTKKWYYGATATFSQLTMRGGTLIVCTDLTINVLNMDSGTIVVRPGAKLTAGASSGMIWRGGCALYNYGRLEITSNLSFEGPYATAARPNILMNVTAASSSRAFNYLVINNPFSFFVNNGLAEVHGVITDNNAVVGSVCLGRTSQLKQTVLINKVKDAYTAPYGYACVSVYQLSQFADTLTDHPHVLVCLSASHTSATGGSNKPNAWGAANVFQNCNSCAEMTLLAVQNTSTKPPASPVVPSAAPTIFPNPFSDIVQIRWENGKKPRSVVIYESTGRIVYYRDLEQERASVLSVTLATSLAAGNYVVKITYPETIIVRKIIKSPR